MKTYRYRTLSEIFSAAAERHHLRAAQARMEGKDKIADEHEAQTARAAARSALASTLEKTSHGI